MTVKAIKDITNKYKLDNIDNLLKFLKSHYKSYTINELRKIAELSNDRRLVNEAYYTNDFIVNDLVKSIPYLNTHVLRVLEPSAGIGNFIIPFIKHNYKRYKKIIIDVNDIDNNSLKLAKFFFERSHIPKNIKINYFNYNFLSGLVFLNPNYYDLVIGNPPFQRISKKRSAECGAKSILNLAGQFFMKSMYISRMVSLIMPKNFLASSDYDKLRDIISKDKIIAINDFGEKGFKGVLIETIGLIVDSKAKPSNTYIYDRINNKSTHKPQNYIDDSKFPSWVIYRNKFFDLISSRMKFNVFKVFRDRQITNKLLKARYFKHSIRVIKSRNIARNGSQLINIKDYDSYISLHNARSLSVFKYYTNNNVYLVPNMTYYPRIIKKNKHFIVNGSVAILIPKKNVASLNKTQLSFINSSYFRKFYFIARNHATRTLNINSKSVFWFGLYKG